MRVRLRPAHDDATLAAMYAAPHDHLAWGYGHDIRVTQTIALAQWLARYIDAGSAADLACGDGAVLDAVDVPTKVYGDLAPRPVSSLFELPRLSPSGACMTYTSVTGPIEATLDTLDPVDLFICSETFEHLDDPDTVAHQIAANARALIASTPLGETTDGNPEHYWGWDHDGFGAMLAAAGWVTVAQVDVAIPDSYTYQLWACTQPEDRP